MTSRDFTRLETALHEALIISREDEPFLEERFRNALRMEGLCVVPQAEIARLRAALRLIAEQGRERWGIDIARAALDAKEATG